MDLYTQIRAEHLDRDFTQFTNHTSDVGFTITLADGETTTVCVVIGSGGDEEIAIDTHDSRGCLVGYETCSVVVV